MEDRFETTQTDSTQPTAFRYTLPQLLLGVALVAIGLTFTQVEGCGKRITLIESISMSADGDKLLVSRLCGRRASPPGTTDKAGISRTISVVDTIKRRARIVYQDFQPGVRYAAHHQWRLGRTSALLDPSGDTIASLSPDETAIAALEHDYRKDVVISKNESPSGTTALVRPVFGVRIIEAANGNVIGEFSLPAGERPIHIDLFPDATMLVCTTEIARRYDFDGNVLSVIPSSEGAYVCSLSHDGTLIAFVEKLIHFGR